MKFMGLGLLIAGWLLVLAAVALLASSALRGVFVLAGIAVEGLGFGLVARCELHGRGDR